MSNETEMEMEFLLDEETTESNVTRSSLIPQGMHEGLIGLPVVEKKESKKKPGMYNIFLILDVDFFGSPSLSDVLDFKDQTSIKRRIYLMLDLKEDGKIATGPNKNVSLGALREACGLNTKGMPFSIRNLAGAKCLFKCTHKPRDDDREIMQENFRNFAPLPA